MKRHFVLDENIVIVAQTHETVSGQPDAVCAELLLTIDRNCHALVLTWAIWQKYSSHIDVLRRQRRQLIPGILKIIKSMLTNFGKDMRLVAPQDLKVVDGLEGLTGVDVGDREFIRAAASVPGSILVTVDGPLRRRLLGEGIAAAHAFMVVTPEEAIALAASVGSRGEGSQ